MTTAPTRLPLTIFCGKGGVGKTTLALSYGLRQATQGRGALVVSSHPLPELAVSVSLSGLKSRSPEAAASLFVIHIDPREILHQYVKSQIPSEMLAEAVVSSSIYQSLIDVAPGLKEMVFLHRLQQLAEERTAPKTAEPDKPSAANKYDIVIWDAPSTGHFLQTLEVSRQFNLYLSGPFATIGKEVADFFSAPESIALLPVTTLEEMAVEETIELCEKLCRKLEMPPRAVVCNMTSPAMADYAAGRANSAAEPRSGGRALRFILDRLSVERALFDQLRSSIKMGLKIVERQPRSGTDLDLLLDLADHLDGIEVAH